MENGRPSETAKKVALNILTLGEKTETKPVLPAGIIDATENLLLASGAVKAGIVKRYRSPWMIRVYEAFDWMMPGQFEAFAHRKAFFERQVREGIADGMGQVLILGAGYDTLGWRLAAEFPDVRFFEIDHPATARLKAKGIEVMGPRTNLHLIARDLGSTRLVDVMNSVPQWDKGVPAVILAEGLLQYLAPEAVRDLLTQCAAIATASRMVFSYIPTHPDGGPDAGPWSGLTLWLLKMGGEPWLWSIRPDQLNPFLAATGWTSAPDLLAEETLRGIERFAVARQSGQTGNNQKRRAHA